MTVDVYVYLYVATYVYQQSHTWLVLITLNTQLVGGCRLASGVSLCLRARCCVCACKCVSPQGVTEAKT